MPQTPTSGRAPLSRPRSLAVAVILAAMASSLPAPASAQEWTEPGVYLALHGVNGFENFQNAEEDFEDSWGFSIRAGYRLNRWLAAEGGFEFLAGFDVDVLLDDPNNPGTPLPVSPNPAPLTVDGGNFTANVKGYLPWFGRFQPYGLVGVGGAWRRLRTSFTTGTVCSPGFVYWYCRGTYTELGTQGGFIARFGGGAEYWLSEDFALTLDATYNILPGSLEDLQYTNLAWGAMFKF